MPVTPRAAGNFSNRLQAGAGAPGQLERGGQHGFKGEVEQTVAGENGLSHAVNHMVGGTAPAQRVVVHAGQVVVNQRIGVNHFHRAGKIQRLLRAAKHIRGGEQHRGPQTLAPAMTL